MAEKNLQATFTPSGGMNQDDSIVTPSVDAAGNSLFALGDYRYALNARIGSSRGDNFGDIENIKDTDFVPNYIGYQRETTQNSPTAFTSGFPGWSTYNSGSDISFSYGSYDGHFGAKITISIAAQSVTLFQSVSEGVSVGDYLRLRYSFVRDGVVLDPAYIVGLYLVYLDGSGIEISSERIDNLNSYSSSLGNPSGDKVVYASTTCQSIGFKIVTNLPESALQYVITSFIVDHIYNVATSTPPAGDNKVIGRFEDQEFLKIYLFYWNSNGDHTIRVYDYVTDTVTELIKWSGLNFQSTSFLKASKLDNWLTFTDKINRPRLIDVNAIRSLFLILGDDFREYHISLHKWAPTSPPVVKAYYNGSTSNNTKLANKVYQFSYRYIYNGKLRSRWSPSSIGVNNISYYTNTGYRVTSIDVMIPGIILDDPDASVQYNYFGHDDIKFTSAVESIEIGYRESQTDLWRSFKTITVESTGNTTARFTLDADSTPLSPDDFFQVFDTVPFLAGTVEAVDNRFFLADCLNEQDPAMTPVVTDVGVVKWTNDETVGTYWNFGSSDASDMTSFSSLTLSQRTDLGLRNLISEWTFKSRGLYKAGIQYVDRNGWISGVYTCENWRWVVAEDAGVTQGANALTFKFGNGFTPPEWAVGYQIVITNCLNISSFMYGVVNSFDTLIDGPAILDIENAPENIRDRIVTHFDNQDSILGSDLDIIAKELATGRTRKTNDITVAGDNKITIPGIWPKLASDLRTTLSSAESLPYISRIYININNWYNSSAQNSGGTRNNPMNNLYYNYRRGDRLRFTGSDVAVPTNAQKKVYDVLILEFTGTAIIIERPSDLLWIPGKPDSTSSTEETRDYIIEVYTPKTPSENDYLYYEKGEWYPILYPLTENRTWSKTDWTYTNNAAVTANDYGDVTVFNKYPLTIGDSHFQISTQYFNYTATRSYSLSFGLASMNQNPKETYNDWERGAGRANIAYLQYPVKKFNPTNVRFGGKIIELSLVNNLNRFRSEDQSTYPTEYGRIRDLVNTANAQVESVGSICLAIGEREAWSIYVNRTTLEDLSGRTQVSTSDKVLGSYNSLLGSHGTLNPESISKRRGNVYYWDAINGCWIRYGRNGLTEISFYKMKNWFREISALLFKEYQTDTPPRVISGYDNFNDEVVTFIDHSSLPATFRGYDTYKGATFSENDTRWKHIHSYAPEFFATMGTVLFSFKDGQVFKHEQGPNYGSFHGTKYDVMIEPVFNMGNTVVKRWMTYTYLATNAWSVDRILSEYRGQKALQQTTIELEQFENREDTYWAAIKNDQNTPNVTNPTIDGDQMRSKAIQVLMKLDPDVDYLSLLHYAMAGFIESPINP